METVRDYGELGICLQRIVKRLFANQNLIKLLYYTGKDPLSEPDLTEEELQELVYEKLVKIVPRVGPYETAQSVLSMRVVRGRGIQENNEFRDIVIHFEVFVPMTQWFIKDSNLRPFAIMSELQKSLNNKIINGMGRMQGGDFSLNFLTDEMSCYEIEYRIVNYE
jgi:hypothetical protein